MISWISYLSFCRIDIQIDWLDFALTSYELSTHEKTLLKNERQQAARKSDEVLLLGGGFSYDSFEKKFFQSKPNLLLHKPTKKVLSLDILQ